MNYDREQARQIDRVEKKIADIILEFYHERILIMQYDFHANDLAEYMNRQIPNTTFDSASRILRLLRQKRKIDYDVVSRKDSHYRLKRLPAKQLKLAV